MCEERNVNLTSHLSDPGCAVCDRKSSYRTITGCCNNLANKALGQINTPLTRLMTNAYSDNRNLPRGGLTNSSLPSPRNISSSVHRVLSTKAKPPVSVMLMQFGQFLDHDISLTPEQGLSKKEKLMNYLTLNIFQNMNVAIVRFWRMIRCYQKT